MAIIIIIIIIIIIQTNSSTQKFSFLCCGLHRLTRPHGHFISIDIVHTDLLVHICFLAQAELTLSAMKSGDYLSSQLTQGSLLSARTPGGYSPFPPTRHSVLSTRTFAVYLISQHIQGSFLFTRTSGGCSTSQHTQGSFLSTRTCGRLLISPTIAGFLYDIRKAIIVQQDLWRLHSFGNLLIKKKLIMISCFTKSLMLSILFFEVVRFNDVIHSQIIHSQANGSY